MSSNNTTQNDANHNGQRQQNAAASSSGVNALFSGIFSRGSPAKQSQRLPQLDVEQKNSAKQTQEEWVDVPEREFLSYCACSIFIGGLRADILL